MTQIRHHDGEEILGDVASPSKATFVELNDAMTQMTEL